MMTDIERSQALTYFGYTARQAHFLTLVALHGGYFLRRQYVQFTECGHGLAAVRFLAKARAHGHVRVLPYARHGALFHLGARPVYAALGQEHNRNRRPAEWVAVVRKLMTLDFVLTRPEAQFWATEEDKTVLVRELDIEEDAWPAKRYRPRHGTERITTRYFVDKMPWYREPHDPRVWFTYVNAESTLAGFDTFLREYVAVLEAVPSGVTYVGIGACRARVEPMFEQWHGRALRRAFSVPAFLDYCAMRRHVEARQIRRLSVPDIVRFGELRSRFAAKSFHDLYRRWEQDGDAAVHAAEADPPKVEPCALRVHELGFRYDP
jgi:hypothetical protein